MRRLNDRMDKAHLCRNGDAEEMDETNVLVPNNLDLIDQTEPAEIVPQLLLSCVFV